MNWHDHGALNGAHSFLSPSKYHWVNYSIEKFDSVYENHNAARLGTRIHAFAAEAIALGIKLPRTKKTLNLFVNDAIGFRLDPEVLLFHSPNAFGTADAIGFRKNVLRIHDLKTGVSQSSFKQLDVYAALFCLEYDVNPNDIEMDLRIYQFDEATDYTPDPADILFVMGKIKEFDSRIEDHQRNNDTVRGW